MKGTKWDISKWRNLGSDIKKIDGIVLCNDGRDGGDAAIVLFE